jgi:hypothetical protein
MEYFESKINPLEAVETGTLHAVNVRYYPQDEL